MTCEFSGTSMFGFGSPDPNAFTCRNAFGELPSEVTLQLQGIRLRGRPQ